MPANDVMLVMVDYKVFVTAKYPQGFQYMDGAYLSIVIAPTLGYLEGQGTTRSQMAPCSFMAYT